MLNRMILFLFINFWIGHVGAQAPEIEWMRTYVDLYRSWGWQVLETADGGFAIAGASFSRSNGTIDGCLIRTDQNGDSLWIRMFGGAGTDEFRSVKETADGGFILAGITSSFGGRERSVYLVKADQAGNEVWYHSYGDFDIQEGRSLGICNDGGYIIAGWASIIGNDDDVYIIKTDSLGELQWTRRFSGNRLERGWSIIQTSDGGYAVAGWIQPSFQSDSEVYVIKLTPDGDSVWSATYGGTENDEGRAIIELPQGGYAIAGKATNGYDIGFGLIIIGPEGEMVRQRNYLGPWSVLAHSLAYLSDGGFILGGYEVSHNRDFVLRTDSEGDTLWTLNLFHGTDITCRSVLQASDGGLVLAGSENRHIYMVKLVPEQTGIGEGAPGNLPGTITLHQNYPNPFNAATQISYGLNQSSRVTISIYNLAGQKVDTIFDGFQDTGEHSVIWDAAAFPSGIYFARLNAEVSSRNVKMLLLK